jgi:hypothetical protein
MPRTHDGKTRTAAAKVTCEGDEGEADPDALEPPLDELDVRWCSPRLRIHPYARSAMRDPGESPGGTHDAHGMVSSPGPAPIVSPPPTGGRGSRSAVLVGTAGCTAVIRWRAAVIVQR